VTGGEAVGRAPRDGLAEEVLVTGASGFLGRPLVAALAGAGRSVTCLSRRQVPPPGAAQRGSVRWVQGDVRHPESYQAHLRAGMTVYHLAGLRAGAGRRAGDFDAVNVTASSELARRCLDRGIRRFVLMTTAHLFGPAAPGETRRESAAVPFADGLEGVAGAAGEPALGCYERSRRAGLLAMRGLVAAGLDAVILCPTIVFGPDHPAYPNRVTSELRRIAGRPFAMLIAGGTAARDLVYVDDVIAAALAAERLAPPGVELLLGGEPTAHRDLLARTLALLGRRGAAPVRISIPAAAALAAARAADRLLRYDAGCGHAAAVVRMLQSWRFDSGRAQKLLGYQPLSLDQGLARTLRWLRGRGTAQ
jgi:nucleoside-diphosphate-sugar epimerase